MIWDLDKETCFLSLMAYLGTPNLLATCSVMKLIVVCKSDITSIKDSFITSHY